MDLAAWKPLLEKELKELMLTPVTVTDTEWQGKPALEVNGDYVIYPEGKLFVSYCKSDFNTLSDKFEEFPDAASHIIFDISKKILHKKLKALTQG